MSNQGKYTEGQVLNILRKAPVSIHNKTVRVDGFVGIKTKGKISFLTKHCGYTLSQN